jgi:replicative DNA helicase
MSNITDRAKDYLKAQLSVIPTKEDKLPALKAWKPYQSKRIKEDEVEALFKGGSVKGIGIICGAISGGLEVIDVDTKYDTTGTLWDELKVLIKDNLPKVYKRLVVAQTKSGGYHLYYRCSFIAGNLKLANRSTTAQEREATYKENIAKGEPEDRAKTISINDKVRVLIETRGEGGYVIAPPASGYSYRQGEPGNIPTITPEERELLFSIAQSFNELEEVKPKINTPSAPTYSSTGLSPFEDYNQRGDIVNLLEGKGWKIVNQIGERINLLRPGQTDSKTSGNFHTGLRVLRVFSSSTEFSPDKGYSPAQVFSLLECNGDNKITYRRLLELGYGEPYNGEAIKPTQVKTERIKVEVVNKVNRESSVISTPGESLKIENLQTASGEEVVIHSPGEEALEEVIKALELIDGTNKRAYVKENGVEVISYRYILQSLFKKYGTLQDKNGGLTDRQIKSLEDEVVALSGRLEPIDRDKLKTEFLELEAIKELGITEESLSITVDRLTSTRDKEAQAKEFKKLLSQATQLQDKGETDKALELLDSKVKEVKITGAKDLLPPPLSFATLLDEIATLPPAYRTGYSSLDNFIGFTPGAISLIAGRPSHGKTTFMFNLLLQMSNLYQDESFYFFTYEEPVKNISVKLLNRLIDTDLSGYFGEIKDLPKPTNYEFIKHYIKARRTDITSVEEGKRKLQELIDSQRIKVIDRNYSVEELSSLIAYLNKRERIGALIIDYIQRMRTERRTQDKRTEIAHISDQVLQIAKDSGLPIILGAQLNRNAQNKPALENLKEAGNLEEDANTVISVYCKAREEEETESGERSSKQRTVELEFKTLKNREGEVNTVEYLDWDRWNGVLRERSGGESHFK